ncbi:hypothetical protein GCM10009429_05990 [Dyella marensis]
MAAMSMAGLAVALSGGAATAAWAKEADSATSRAAESMQVRWRSMGILDAWGSQCRLGPRRGVEQPAGAYFSDGESA